MTCILHGVYVWMRQALKTITGKDEYKFGDVTRSVYTHTYAHTHTHTCTHARARACSPTLTPLPPHTHRHIHTHTQKYSNQNMRRSIAWCWDDLMRTHTDTVSHTHTLSLTHTHTYIHTCTHTHTRKCTHEHTHAHSQPIFLFSSNCISHYVCLFLYKNTRWFLYSYKNRTHVLCVASQVYYCICVSPCPCLCSKR